MADSRIRLTTAADIAVLPAVERSAAQSFRQIAGLGWLADEGVMPEWRHTELMAAGTSWVAADGGEPAGFLAAEAVGAELHIWEVAVRRDQQGRGLGAALVRKAVDCAAARGLAAVTLTTFRDVPWNQPFYEKIGFVTLAAGHSDPRLAAILRSEVEQGLPGERRCAMRLVI